jgi:hypothetical protein
MGEQLEASIRFVYIELETLFTSCMAVVVYWLRLSTLDDLC